MKTEIRIAIAVIGADFNILQQGIMYHVIKNALKRGKNMCKDKCKDKCKEECKDKCKTECAKKTKDCGKGECEFMKKVKCITKKFLVCKKDKLLQKMQLAFDTFTKVKGIPVPPADRPMPPKKFLKKVAKLMFKIYKKGLCTKESQEEYAEKFWNKDSKKHIKKMKKKTKEIVKKILYYECGDIDEEAKPGIARALTYASVGFATMKFHMPPPPPPHHEEKKEGPPHGEKKEGPPCGPCGPCGPFGFFGPPFPFLGPPPPGHHGPCGPPPPPPHFGGKKGHKFMKHIFEKFLIMSITKYGVDFIKENKEIAKTCLALAKPEIEAYLKDNPPFSCCCPKKLANKLLKKVIAQAILVSLGEKKTDEFYTELIKNYIKGNACYCDKKCLKSCRKLAKVGLLFNGVKSKCQLRVASRWASLMCCQVNGKDGCPKVVCAEYLNKWIKDYIPVVEEGFKALDEFKEEIKDKTKPEEFHKEIPGKKFMCKVMSKLLLRYLKMYCRDCKFNKDDFKTKAKESHEALKKYSDKYMKKCCPKGCEKPEEKK